MREYLELGPVPANEQCAQVGAPDYSERSREECQRYINQLKREFPIPDDLDCRYVIKSFPHDFGSYREVCIAFDNRDSASIDFAFNVEENAPAHWTD